MTEAKPVTDAERLSSSLGGRTKGRSRDDWLTPPRLLRQAFKGLTTVHEPVDWSQVGRAVPHMLVDAAGALAIFVALAAFYRLQRHAPITLDSGERTSFVAAKKADAPMTGVGDFITYEPYGLMFR